MSTLGQRMQANAKKPVSLSIPAKQAFAEEAKRVERQLDSLKQALAAAKKSITGAIEAGKAEHLVCYKVLDKEPAYEHIKRLSDGRPIAYGPERGQLQGLWDAFQLWATSEDLELTLSKHLPDVNEGVWSQHCYVVIYARFSH